MNFIRSKSLQKEGIGEPSDTPFNHIQRGGEKKQISICEKENNACRMHSSGMKFEEAIARLNLSKMKRSQYPCI